jgi:hypothetical protein
VVLVAAGACTLLVAALVGAQDLNTDESAPPGTSDRTPKAAGCPKLSDSLWRVTQSDDWAATAVGLGVPVVDDKVRVIVELVSAQDPPSELPGIIEAQYLQFVQVLIEPALLCTLASTEGVVSINPPFPSAPAGPLRP